MENQVARLFQAAFKKLDKIWQDYYPVFIFGLINWNRILLLKIEWNSLKQYESNARLD